MRQILQATLVMVAILLGGSPVLAQKGALPERLTGEATNVSVGASTGVTITLSQTANGMVAAYGEFDNKALIGAFSVEGRELRCSGGSRCLQMVGMLRGLEAGGFPEGTVTSFMLTLMLPAGNGPVEGVFVLGTLPGYDFVQMGVMRLTAE